MGELQIPLGTGNGVWGPKSHWDQGIGTPNPTGIREWGPQIPAGPAPRGFPGCFQRVPWHRGVTGWPWGGQGGFGGLSPLSPRCPHVPRYLEQISELTFPDQAQLEQLEQLRGYNLEQEMRSLR